MEFGGRITHEVMKPIYCGIIIVRKTFAYGRRGKSLFILAHIRANDGLMILFMLNGAQTSIIGGVGEEFGTLVWLLEILRHALTTTDDLLLKKSESQRQRQYMSRLERDFGLGR